MSIFLDPLLKSLIHQSPPVNRLLSVFTLICFLINASQLYCNIAMQGDYNFLLFFLVGYLIHYNILSLRQTFLESLDASRSLLLKLTMNEHLLSGDFPVAIIFARYLSQNQLDSRILVLSSEVLINESFVVLMEAYTQW